MTAREATLPVRSPDRAPIMAPMRAPLLLAAAVWFGACGGGDDGDGRCDCLTTPDGALVAGDSGVDSGASDPVQLARVACVTETNRLRATVGKPAVAESAPLETYANAGAQEDFAGSPHDHFRRTQGGGISFAENECPHWSLSGQGGGDYTQLVKACIAAFFSEGPGGGHYDNMTGNYGTLGCGIYASGGSVTIIQDFGR